MERLKLPLSLDDAVKLAHEAIAECGDVFYDPDEFGDSELTNERMFEYVADTIARKILQGVSLALDRIESGQWP